MIDTAEKARQEMIAKGYVLDPLLDIIGVRSTHSRPNYFDDTLYAFSRGLVVGLYRITTLPGLHFLKNPLNPNGTAILVPGQYEGAYRIGLHKESYPALVQIKSVKVYRDNDQDDAFDMLESSIETGHFGINIHKAGFFSKLVGASSAGCQVFQKEEDFNEFMTLCVKSNKKNFTYTLLES